MKEIIIGLTILILMNCNRTGLKQNIPDSNNTLQSDKNNLKTYSWNEELCEYTGKYDSSIIKYVQLKNSYDLGFISDRFNVRTKTGPYTTNNKIKEIGELNVDSLDCECSSKLKDLKTLKIIESKYWQDLKNQKIKELTKECELSKLLMLSYSSPDTLRSIENPNECEKYINGLVSGGDELLKVWKELKEERASKFGINEWENKEFQAEYNSDDRIKYAKIYVLNYGWWNSIVQTIPRTENSDFHNKFIKNFIDIKKNCAEP